MWSQTSRIGYWAVAAGLLLGCAADTPQPLDVTEALEAANSDFVAAFARSDAAALAGLYTEDAQLLPPNSDVVSGPTAIQELWQAVMDAGVAEMRLTLEEAEGSGDTAFEVGRYSLHDADGNAIDDGKYIVIWKRAQGRWRLHRDIWNTSRPAVSQ